MRMRLVCVVLACWGFVSKADAAERSGLVHRASCAVVRLYVTKFSAPVAEAWARSHGATEAEIEDARHCLTRTPTQTTQATHWTEQ